MRSHYQGLRLTTVNANVHGVHLADGMHVGNLKRIGNIWKFKAVGYDTTGAVEPGGGPLTHHHNTTIATPEAAALGAAFSAPLPNME